jgi:WD40 repeat protein
MDHSLPPSPLKRPERASVSSATIISAVSALFLLSAGAWYLFQYYQDNRGTEMVLSGHRANVTTLSWTSDGGLLLSMDDGRTGADSTRAEVIVWDARNGSKLCSLATGALFPEAAALSPVGDVAVCAMRDPAAVDVSVIGFFDPRRGAALGEIRVPGAAVSRVLFSPGGTRFAVFSDGIYVWDVRNRKCIDSLHADNVLFGFDCVFRAEDALPAVGHHGDTLLLFDVARHTQRALLIRGLAESGRVALSPNGTVFHVLTHDSLRSYSTVSGTRLSGAPCAGHGSGLVLPSADGSRLLLQQDVSHFRLIDRAKGGTITTLNADPATSDATLQAVFSRDGKRFALSSSANGDIGVFNAKTGLRTQTVKHRERLIGAADDDCLVAFPPGANLLATAKKDIRIWKLD